MKNLIAILGQFGEGKSLKLVEVGIHLSHLYGLRIVANFPLNRRAVADYAISKGYKPPRIVYFDILERARFLSSRSSKKNYSDFISQAVTEFLSSSDSIILFDEVGVFLNSRSWQTSTIDLLSAIFQLRKENSHLVCAFQNYSQVDKQLRENIQQYIVCSGISKYDKSLRLPRLFARFAYYYDPETFHKRQEIGYNFFRSWLSATKVEYSFFGFFRFLTELETFRRYFSLQFVNVFRFYLRKPLLPLRICATDEERLFRCFQSAKRLDRFRSRAEPIYVNYPTIKKLKRPRKVPVK